MKTKRYDELTFSDDFMFCKVLQSREDLCVRLLELILDRKVGRIIRLDKQHPIDITADGKGVRFDVYLEDDEGVVYDIEMQTTKDTDLPRRARYYQSMIDLDCMDRGMGYNELKRSVIIFICAYDPFGCGLSRYSVVSQFRENAGKYDDGTEKVFLSAAGDGHDVPDELREFLAYIAGRPAKGNLALALAQQVEHAKGHQEWRQEYMTLYEIKEEIRKEAHEEGLAEGREEERRIIAAAMKKHDIPLEVIAETTGLTAEALEEL